MIQLPDIPAGKIGVLLAPQPVPDRVAALTAALALQGAVRLLDGGNRFRPYAVARQLRRQTADIETALARITIARAFTAYQLLSLFAQTPATAVPLLALDLLATFSDESISTIESVRLLKQLLPHLQRLRRQAPVIITVCAPPQAERTCLLTLLQETSDLFFAQQEVKQPVTSPLLFRKTSWEEPYRQSTKLFERKK